MGFYIKYYATITASLINWFSGNNTKITDMVIGSSIRTMFESIGIELEAIYYQIFTGITNGIQTAVYNSFNFPPLQPQAASGSVTFSNSTAAPVGGTTIPAGTQVSTQGVNGSTPVVYQTTDTVVIPAGQTSVSAFVVATVTGSVGNAIAGAINQLVGSPAGVSAVINPVAFFTGRDLETPAAQALRFQNYIANLTRATLGAIENAAAGVPNVTAAYAFESPIMNVFVFSGITGFRDISFEANLPSGGPQAVLNQTVEANDALYIGSTNMFSLLKIDLDLGMVGGVYVWEYFSLTSNSWVSLAVNSDSTSNLAKSGYLAFTQPTDWIAATVNSVQKFFIRLRVVTPSTSQVATAVQIKASPFPGIIFLVAMDAAATLPSSLLTAVANAVAAYRGAGVSVFVTGPTVTPVNVSVNVQADLTADPVALNALVVQAIQTYFSQFTLGQEFIMSQLVQFVRNQSIDILDLQILSPLTNLPAGFDQIFQAGTITVNVSQ